MFNPVAKHAFKVNRSAVIKPKKSYNKKDKRWKNEHSTS